MLYGPLGAACFEELQHRLMEATADLNGSDGADTASDGVAVQYDASADYICKRQLIVHIYVARRIW